MISLKVQSKNILIFFKFSFFRDDLSSKISGNSNYTNYEDYGTNRKNQDKTLDMLKKAKMKKEFVSLKTEEKQEDNFWGKVGSFFGIFECNTKKQTLFEVKFDYKHVSMNTIYC